MTKLIFNIHDKDVLNIYLFLTFGQYIQISFKCMHRLLVNLHVLCLHFNFVQTQFMHWYSFIYHWCTCCWSIICYLRLQENVLCKLMIKIWFNTKCRFDIPLNILNMRDEVEIKYNIFNDHRTFCRYIHSVCWIITHWYDC